MTPGPESTSAGGPPRPGGGTVEDLVLERLDHADLPQDAQDLVVAALVGDDALAAALGGTPPAVRSDGVPETTAEATGAYLTGIEVSGFRGIGPAVTLPLAPGPGLTLVTGRNGSGKSSFAEAAELTLTGDSKRWADRGSVVWRQGWRNLHADGPSYLRIGLALDGRRGATVERHWDRDADLDDARSFLQVVSERKAPLDDLGWAAAMELHRPFLSYEELGAVLAGKPSEMYDSLQRILGLETLVALEARLREARRQLTVTSRRATEVLPELLSRLADHPDARAREAELILGRRPWDLDRLDQVAEGDVAGDEAVHSALRRLAGLAVPDTSNVENLVAKVATAQRRVTDLNASPATDASRVATLLRGALAYHESYPGDPCPVCGGKPLDTDWAAVARNQVAHLDQLARDLHQARAAMADGLDQLRGLLPRRPAILLDDAPGVDASAAREAWQRWDALIHGPDPHRIAAEAGTAYADVAATVDAVRHASEQALRRHQQAWQPVADEIRRWTAVARESTAARRTLDLVTRALTWLRTVGQEIRDARLAPVAEQAAAIWAELRQESSVDLGRIRLAGTGNRRHVKLDVTLDGEPSSALAVMSQGELHALALTLFLPRATLPESPFRFLVIDDPVQSMDPAKVYGLARVLAGIAETRQVVVFTHDDRLSQAVRHLQIEATILEVARRERSVVKVRPCQDPVTRYLEDAVAVARSDRLPEASRNTVVAGFIRHAIEAACHERVRTRKLKAGVPHARIEQVLIRAHRLREVLALALFDDAGRWKDVNDRLRRLDSRAPGLIDALNRGVHGDSRVSPAALVGDGRRLAEALRRP